MKQKTTFQGITEINPKDATTVQKPREQKKDSCPIDLQGQHRYTKTVYDDSSNGRVYFDSCMCGKFRENTESNIKSQSVPVQEPGEENPDSMGGTLVIKSGFKFGGIEAWADDRKPGEQQNKKEEWPKGAISLAGGHCNKCHATIYNMTYELWMKHKKECRPQTIPCFCSTEPGEQQVTNRINTGSTRLVEQGIKPENAKSGATNTDVPKVGEQGQSYFDLPDSEKQRIINRAARESNEKQAELMKQGQTIDEIFDKHFSMWSNSDVETYLGHVTKEKWVYYTTVEEKNVFIEELKQALLGMEDLKPEPPYLKSGRYSLEVSVRNKLRVKFRESIEKLMGGGEI